MEYLMNNSADHSDLTSFTSTKNESDLEKDDQVLCGTSGDSSRKSILKQVTKRDKRNQEYKIEQRHDDADFKESELQIGISERSRKTPHTNLTTGMNNLAGVVKCRSCTLYPPKSADSVVKVKKKVPYCKSIWIGGLPENTTDKVINDVFDRFGKIIEIKRKRKSHFGRIHYESEESVDKALAFSGYRLVIGEGNSPDDSGIIFIDYSRYNHNMAILQPKRHPDMKTEEKSLTVSSQKPCTKKEIRSSEKVKNNDKLVEALQDTQIIYVDGDSTDDDLVIYDVEPSTKKTKSDIGHQEKKLHSEIQTHKNEIAKLKSRLKEEVDDLNKQLETTNNSLNMSKDELLKAKNDLGKAEARVSELVELNKNLQTETENRLSRQTKKYKTIQRRLMKLKPSTGETIEELQADKTKLLEIIEEKNTQNGKLTKMKQLFEDVKEKIINLQAENDLLLKEKNELENKMKDYMKKQQDITFLNTQLHSIKSEAINQIRHLQHELADARNGDNFSAREARLIGLLSTFLLPYCLGANLDDILSYIKKFQIRITKMDLESLMGRCYTAFKKNPDGSWALNLYSEIAEDVKNPPAKEYEMPTDESLKHLSHIVESLTEANSLTSKEYFDTETDKYIQLLNTGGSISKIGHADADFETEVSQFLQELNTPTEMKQKVNSSSNITFQTGTSNSLSNYKDSSEQSLEKENINQPSNSDNASKKRKSHDELDINSKRVKCKKRITGEQPELLVVYGKILKDDKHLLETSLQPTDSIQTLLPNLKTMFTYIFELKPILDRLQSDLKLRKHFSILSEEYLILFKKIIAVLPIKFSGNNENDIDIKIVDSVQCRLNIKHTHRAQKYSKKLQKQFKEIQSILVNAGIMSTNYQNLFDNIFKYFKRLDFTLKTISSSIDKIRMQHSVRNKTNIDDIDELIIDHGDRVDASNQDTKSEITSTSSELGGINSIGNEISRASVICNETTKQLDDEEHSVDVQDVEKSIVPQSDHSKSTNQDTNMKITDTSLEISHNNEETITPVIGKETTTQYDDERPSVNIKNTVDHSEEQIQNQDTPKEIIDEVNNGSVPNNEQELINQVISNEDDMNTNLKESGEMEKTSSEELDSANNGKSVTASLYDCVQIDDVSTNSQDTVEQQVSNTDSRDIDNYMETSDVVVSNISEMNTISNHDQASEGTDGLNNLEKFKGDLNELSKLYQDFSTNTAPLLKDPNRLISSNILQYIDRYMYNISSHLTKSRWILESLEDDLKGLMINREYEHYHELHSEQYSTLFKKFITHFPIESLSNDGENTILERREEYTTLSKEPMERARNLKSHTLICQENICQLRTYFLRWYHKIPEGYDFLWGYMKYFSILYNSMSKFSDTIDHYGSILSSKKLAGRYSDIIPINTAINPPKETPDTSNDSHISQTISPNQYVTGGRSTEDGTSCPNVISTELEWPRKNKKYAEDNLKRMVEAHRLFHDERNALPSNIHEILDEHSSNSIKRAIQFLKKLHVNIIVIRALFCDFENSPECYQHKYSLSEDHFIIFQNFLKPLLKNKKFSVNQSYTVVNKFVLKLTNLQCHIKICRRFAYRSLRCVSKLGIHFEEMKNITIDDCKIFSKFQDFFQTVSQYFMNLKYSLSSLKKCINTGEAKDFFGKMYAECNNFPICTKMNESKFLIFFKYVPEIGKYVLKDTCSGEINIPQKSCKNTAWVSVNVDISDEQQDLINKNSELVGGKRKINEHENSNDNSLPDGSNIELNTNEKSNFSNQCKKKKNDIIHDSKLVTFKDGKKLNPDNTANLINTDKIKDSVNDDTTEVNDYTNRKVTDDIEISSEKNQEQLNMSNEEEHVQGILSDTIMCESMSDFAKSIQNLRNELQEMFNERDDIPFRGVSDHQIVPNSTIMESDIMKSTQKLRDELNGMFGESDLKTFENSFSQHVGADDL